MNSKERRKQKREFPHVINLIAESGIRYFEHDDKVMVARNWCNRECEGGYRVITRYDHAEFKFTMQKDAVIFALKWL